MLILSRKVGEQIVLPNCQTTLTVLAVRGTRVRLGISGPQATQAYRREVWQRICQQPPVCPKGASMPRVLIADSDQHLSACYREHLSQSGFLVRTVTSGLDCLEQLRSWMPDVLVLEPGILWGGGDGVLTLMHEDPDVPLVPVIVLTHGCPSMTLYNIAPFRVDDYHKKPISARQLADRIRLVLGYRHESATPARQG